MCRVVLRRIFFYYLYAHEVLTSPKMLSYLLFYSPLGGGLLCVALQRVVQGETDDKAFQLFVDLIFLFFLYGFFLFLLNVLLM